MKMGAANLNRESFPIFGAVGRRFGSTERADAGGRGRACLRHLYEMNINISSFSAV